MSTDFKNVVPPKISFCALFSLYYFSFQVCNMSKHSNSHVQLCIHYVIYILSVIFDWFSSSGKRLLWSMNKDARWMSASLNFFFDSFWSLMFTVTTLILAEVLDTVLLRPCAYIDKFTCLETYQTSFIIAVISGQIYCLLFLAPETKKYIWLTEWKQESISLL